MSTPSETPSLPAWRYKLARLAFWLWRFRTPGRAERFFESVSSPCMLRRKLFGYEMCLDVSRATIQQRMYLEGDRAIDERGIVLSLLSPGMRAVDVGANIGYYLLMIERGVGPTGEVVCIEPSPENLPELRATIAANSFSNVEVHEIAVGSENRRTEIKGGLNSGIVGDGAGAYDVELRTLDSLVADGRRVDFIKIDVEGYELQVLRGAQRILEEHKPRMFLEVHPVLLKRFGDPLSELAALLHDRYEDITYYEYPPPESQGILHKLAVRYLGQGPFVQIDEPAKAVAECEAGTREEGFWVVCQ